jgi:hypothetical protein
MTDTRLPTYNMTCPLCTSSANDITDCVFCGDRICDLCAGIVAYNPYPRFVCNACKLEFEEITK